MDVEALVTRAGGLQSGRHPSIAHAKSPLLNVAKPWKIRCLGLRLRLYQVAKAVKNGTQSLRRALGEPS
jgi:hypothetical protein